MSKNFVSEEQFLRARKIVRKLMYQNTIEDGEHSKYGIFDYNERRQIIGIEGHKLLNINIPSFIVQPGDLEKIKKMEEFQKQDDIDVSDRGFQITLRPEEENQ